MKLRNVIAILAVVAFVVGVFGCKGSTPTTPTGVINAVDQALCNPSDAVKADAAAVASFIQSGLSAAAAIYPPAAPISGVSVAGIFDTVMKGGCVFAEDLKAALAWFDALPIPKATATKKAVVKPAGSALRAWLPKK